MTLPDFDPQQLDHVIDDVWVHIDGIEAQLVIVEQFAQAADEIGGAAVVAADVVEDPSGNSSLL